MKSITKKTKPRLIAPNDNIEIRPVSKNKFDYNKYDEYDLSNKPEEIKPIKNKKPEYNNTMQLAKPKNINTDIVSAESITVEELTIENDIKLKHVIIAVEKLIQMMQNMDEKIDNINDKMLKLERDCTELTKNNEYKNYSFEADDALKEWMMEEKNKDSLDHPMSKNEIQKAFVDYNKRSGK